MATTDAKVHAHLTFCILYSLLCCLCSDTPENDTLRKMIPGIVFRALHTNTLYWVSFFRASRTKIDNEFTYIAAMFPYR